MGPSRSKCASTGGEVNCALSWQTAAEQVGVHVQMASFLMSCRSGAVAVEHWIKCSY